MPVPQIRKEIGRRPSVFSKYKSPNAVLSIDVPVPQIQEQRVEVQSVTSQERLQQHFHERLQLRNSGSWQSRRSPQRENVNHESDIAKETMSVTVKLAKEIDELYDIELPTAECQSRTPSERSRVTHKDDASQGKKEEGARCRGVCLDVVNESFQEKDGYMDDSRPVQGGGEDTVERVMTRSARRARVMRRSRKRLSFTQPLGYRY